MNTPLTILNVMFGKGLGGIEQVFVDYADALASQGHKVVQVTHPRANIVPQLVEAHHDVRFISNMGWWDMLAKWRMARLAKALQADVIIAHGNRATQLMFGCDGCTRLAVAHNYKLKPQGFVDGVITITQHSADFWHEKHNWPRDKLAHIPNMIALPEPHESIYPMRDAPVFGCMARLVEKKGVDMFLRAFAKVQKHQPNVRAMIAGDGPERDALEALSEELGIEDAVSWLGWVSDKSAFYRAIDVFCLPSHHEPFGIVLLEAMQYGKVIVSTMSEGPVEILSHQQHGLLAAVGDEKAFANEMAYVIDKPDAAMQMAERAQAHVYEHYHLPQVAVALSDVVKRWAS